MVYVKTKSSMEEAMRSRMNHTVSVRDVHAHAASLVEEHLKIQDHGRKCLASVLIGC